MTGRGHRVTRSASREQASPPPVPTGSYVAATSPSPTRRPTHNTRAASQDLDDVKTELPARRSNRGTRQTSIESTGSANSRTNRNMRNQPIMDLTTVEEVQETELTDDQLDDKQPAMDESAVITSNFSKTTAQQSQSLSQQEISDLDPSLMLTFLPDLMQDAIQVVQLLTPPNKSNATDFVGEVMKQLQIPGSRHATLLKKRERSFEDSREPFVGNEHYINEDYVIRAFSGNSEPSLEVSGISNVLQVANLATLIKKVAVVQPEDPDAVDILQNLDGVFPAPFSGDIVQSKIDPETFSLGLSIRTQTAIAVLQKHQDADNFDPDEVLAQIFFEMLDKPLEGLTIFESTVAHGKLLNIAGYHEESFEFFKSNVEGRMQSIRQAFFDDTQAQEDGEYVDFNVLQEKFPWVKFVAELAQWTRSRLGEIDGSLREKGGIQSVIKSLQAAVGDRDQEDLINLDFDPPAPSFELGGHISDREDDEAGPLPLIKTLYKGLNSVRAMLNSSPIPPSAQITSSSQTPNKATRSTNPSTLPARITDEMRETARRGLNSQENNGTSTPDNPQSTVAKMLRLHNAKVNETNKENRQPTKKGTLFDRQATAHRVEWTDEESQIAPTTSLRNRRSPMDEESDSDVFEEDQRPERMREGERPPKRTRTVEDESDEVVPEPARGAQRPQKRIRNAEQEEDEVARALQNAERRRRREELQANTKANDDEAEQRPRSTYSEVNQKSKMNAKPTSVGVTQKRVPWSEAECEQLVEMIGDYGSNWATIFRLGTFHSNRDQVGLKDKARNMKVDYLRSGADLPPGFDHVALGKKEVEKVKASGRNPYRKEGEAVGEESLDMDGEEI